MVKVSIFSGHDMYLKWREVEAGQAVRSIKQPDVTYIKTILYSNNNTQLCFSDVTGRFWGIPAHELGDDAVFYPVDVVIKVFGVQK